MSRELLHRALDALEELEAAGAGGYSNVMTDLRAELARPRPQVKLEAIKAEADKFIEWPTADRTAVSTTTALLFARHCAEKTAYGTWT